MLGGGPRADAGHRALGRPRHRRHAGRDHRRGPRHPLSRGPRRRPRRAALRGAEGAGERGPHAHRPHRRFPPRGKGDARSAACTTPTSSSTRACCRRTSRPRSRTRTAGRGSCRRSASTSRSRPRTRSSSATTSPSSRPRARCGCAGAWTSRRPSAASTSAPGGKVFLQEREFAIQSGRIAWNGTTDPEIAITRHDGHRPARRRLPDHGGGQRPAGDAGADPALDARALRARDRVPDRHRPHRRRARTAGRGWSASRRPPSSPAASPARWPRSCWTSASTRWTSSPSCWRARASPPPASPSARDFGRTLRLIYSTSLADPELQYYQALFRFREGMELSAKLQRRFDGTFTYSLGQRLRFGASGAPPREAREFEQVEITAVARRGRAAGLPGRGGGGGREAGEQDHVLGPARRRRPHPRGAGASRATSRR